MSTYPLGDTVPLHELRKLGINSHDDVKGARAGFQGGGDGKYVLAVSAHEKRAPKKGEWYLSGAIPIAYRAPNDLSQEFHIMRLVLMQRKTEVTWGAVR